MLHELLEKEEQAALSDFNSFVAIKPSIKTLSNYSKNDNDNYSCNVNIKEILDDLVARSHNALKECQLIESLDRQLRLLTDAQITLKKNLRLKEISKIIENNYETLPLIELIPLLLELRDYSKYKLDTNENYHASPFDLDIIVKEKIPERIDNEIQKVLNEWTDDVNSRDPETLEVIGDLLRLNSSNPLHALFAAFPLYRLKPLLIFHQQLSNTQRLERMYPDRLLNRFYDILGSNRDAEGAGFVAGQLEEITPNNMKFATRISCILEATWYFIRLHKSIYNYNNNINFDQVIINKCSQIVRQIRKTAQVDRAYTNSAVPSILNSQLNEICIICAQLNEFLHEQVIKISAETLAPELTKWQKLYRNQEEIYLLRGIQRAIEMDQIVVQQDSEFPVSSCVDDIFYVLQASKSRVIKFDSITLPMSFLIPNSFNEFFLKVIRKHLENAILTLKPLNLVALEVPFKPTRELISTLVLINNLIATHNNWKSFASDDNYKYPQSIDREIENLLNFGVESGLYVKVLQRSFKNELIISGPDLFLVIRSLLQTTINLFKVRMISLISPLV